MAIADLKKEAADATAREIVCKGGVAMGLAMDVSDERQVDDGVDAVAVSFGGIDVLVSNAGIQIVHPIEEFSYAEWKKMLAIHLDGAFLTTRACLRHMYRPKRSIAHRQPWLVHGIAPEDSMKTIPIDEAVSMIPHGASLMIGGFMGCGTPEPLACALQAAIFEPLDVQEPGQLEAVFDRVRQPWGRLDIALHAIAFAPKEDLQGELLNCSAAGFALAMDVSCHSFVRMARLAVPLMTEGGTLLAMTYHGADKVIPNYAVMGPVKAALESVVRYLAFELGPKDIRVHAVSPGPVKTRAASGLKDFDLLLAAAKRRSHGRTGGHRRCGNGHGLPRDAVCPADHRHHALRGWRIEHHGVGKAPLRWRTEYLRFHVENVRKK